MERGRGSDKLKRNPVDVRQVANLEARLSLRSAELQQEQEQEPISRGRNQRALLKWVFEVVD